MSLIPMIKGLTWALKVLGPCALAATLEQALKRGVRVETRRLIRKGLITRPDECQLCGGEGPTQAHHIQYDAEGVKYVEFFCQDCHNYIHRPAHKAVR